MVQLTYICPYTSMQCYTSISIQHPRVLNMHHTSGIRLYMVPTQYVEDTQDSPALSPKYVTCLQQLGGTLLYYARAVDPTLIMTVNVLASDQTRATAATADKIIKLLNYCTTHP
jgi:hypothetical protein